MGRGHGVPALGVPALGWRVALALSLTLGASAGCGVPSEDCALTNTCGDSAGASCVEEAAACAGATPVCNVDSGVCEGCRHHGQCPESACNPFTGACLAATPRSVGPSGADFKTLSAALESVAADEDGVLLVAANVGFAPYPESLAVNQGRVVAILGTGGGVWVNGGAEPAFTVSNSSTLLLARVALGGGNAVGVSVAGRLALDGVDVVLNGGGLTATGDEARLLVRNSVIARNGNLGPAVFLGGSTLEVLYSSMAAESNAIRCTQGHTLSVRNSVLFNEHQATPTLAGCEGASVVDSATDEELGENMTFAVESGLFEDLAGGNLRLSAAGVAAFSGAARWRVGDPPTDIDGAARPAQDETADVAGADLGP